MDFDFCEEKTLDHLKKSSDEGKRNRNDSGDTAKGAKKQKQETDTSNDSNEVVSEEDETDEEVYEEEESSSSSAQEVLLLRHTHTATSNCRHSIKKFLQDMEEIEDVEIPEDLDKPIEAVVVGNLDAKEVRERFKATEYDVIVTEKLRGVVSIRATEKNDEAADDGDTSLSTGFVVYTSGARSMILTTSHGFDASKKYDIEVTNSSFGRQVPASLWFRSAELDFCFLKVEDESFGSGVVELRHINKRVNFGEQVISIGCPSFVVCDVAMVSPSIKKLVNILWFVLSYGVVSHPFIVGAPNGCGIYIKLCGGDFGAGASGSPILNVHGEVIGLYTNTTTDEETCDIAHWALSIESVMEEFEKSLSSNLKSNESEAVPTSNSGSPADEMEREQLEEQASLMRKADSLKDLVDQSWDRDWGIGESE